MPANDEDFWPDLGAEVAVTPPVAILRKQASLLSEKSQHDLIAQVATDAFGDSFVHRLNLVVPALGEYTYELLQVRHSLDLYPVTGIANSAGVNLNTEADFLKWLKTTLSSEKTKQVLSTLLAQVRS
jgi:hypothetical protein